MRELILLSGVVGIGGGILVGAISIVPLFLSQQYMAFGFILGAAIAIISSAVVVGYIFIQK